MDTRLPFAAAALADTRRAPARALTLAVPALLVAVALALLPALAHASPADPSWLAGVWDAADSDDVVVLVGSAIKAVSAPVAAQDRLEPRPTQLIAPGRDHAPSVPLRDVLRSRGPPLAG
jgi:hypothetical protein